MRALRKLTAALACGSMLSWSAAPALATMPGQTVALLKRVDKGPGSPGFLPNCQGAFALMNWLTYTNTFTGTTNWAGASPGGTNNPTFPNGSKSDTAPDGTTTATDVTIQAVPSGTTNYSTVWIPTATSSTNFASFNDWTFQVWVKDTTGAGTGNAFISVRAATTEAGAITANSDTTFNSIFNNAYSTGYASTPIPNDGQWHLVSVWVPANFTPSNVHVFALQVGVDRRDTAYQTTAALPGTGQAKTLVLWHAGFFNGHSEGGRGWQVENVPAGSIFTAGIQNDASTGPLNTTTPVNATLQCPYPLAVRDYTQLHPWIAGEASGTPPPTLLNGVAQLLVQSGTGYKYGGLGNPFWGSTAAYQLTGTYAGQRCGFSSSTDGTTPNSTGTHNDWFTTFVSCGKDLWNTAEALPNNWQIQVPGSTIGTSNVGMSSPCNTTCGTAQNISATSTSYNPSNGQMTITVPVGTQVPTSVAVTVAGMLPAQTSTVVQNVNGTFPVVSTTSTTITYQLPNTGGTWTYSSGGTAAGAAAMNSYILHAWMLPQNPTTGAGCTVNSTNYTYCMMLSAKAGTNGNGGHSMFLAYSNTIDSAWCMYINDTTHSSGNLCANGAASTPGGSTIYSPTPVLSGAPTLIGGSTNTPMNAPSLPTIIQVNGQNFGNGPSSTAVNYMIVPGSSGSAYTWQLWAAPAGDGFNWRYVGQVNPPPGTQQTGSATVSSGNGYPGDWDLNTGRIDPSIYKNKCGWYELNYTAFKSNSYQGRTGTPQSQAIGVMVSTDIRGPYYLFNGPGTAWNGLLPAMNASGGIFPYDSNIFNNQKNVGETNVWDEYGKYFWSGNEDSGGGFSGAAGAYMKDACQ